MHSSGPAFDDVDHYHRLYERSRRTYRFRAPTAATARRWQEEFRPVLREHLGLDRMAEALMGHRPVAERVDGGETVSGDGYTRERWVLWTEPTLPLPFHLVRPDPMPEGPLPLVLTPHGHNQPDLYVGIVSDDAQRAKIEEGERDVALQGAREGYLVIAPTTRGFGDTRRKAEREKDALSSCREQLLHGLLVGRTAIGERVWDMERLHDWAVANLPVDPGRTAITGNSGGGTVSLFAAACSERWAAAAPSCYFCTFEASIGTLYHCACNYVPGILDLGDMADIAGLVAPRPLSLVNGRDDEIFPIEAARAAFADLEPVYDTLGTRDRVQHYIGDGGHRYYSAGVWPFFRQWL